MLLAVLLTVLHLGWYIVALIVGAIVGLLISRRIFANKEYEYGIQEAVQNENFTKGEYTDQDYIHVKMLDLDNNPEHYLFTKADLKRPRERAYKNLEDFIENL